MSDPEMEQIKRSIHFEASDMWEDCATFAVVEGPRPLAVSVSEEKAVDSYNNTFECTLHMTPDQIGQLRDWLNQQFPAHS